MDIDKPSQSRPHHRPGALNKEAHDGDLETTSEPADKSDHEDSDHNDDLTNLNSSSLREKISSEVKLY